MRIFSKYKVKVWRDNGIYGENEIAQKFKRLLDTPECRMYSGRRMFRCINVSRIRRAMAAAKYFKGN